MKLTEKQKRFADYYIETANAAESAIKAGYSKKTAKEIGSENLTKPNIRSYIDERLAEKDKNRIADQDEVLEFLTKLLRGEITEQVPITMKDYWEMTDKEPALKDRTKAAELLGKRYAMWTDKQQVEGDLGIKVVVDYGDGDE